MVGDDACSVCASLIQKLLEFIANMEHNKQYRKGMKPPKTPKIKTGKLSKKCFTKLQQAGTSFEYLPVPKELMPQFETAMKKMGGTFFTGGIEDNNNIYVAIPAAQRNMAALAAQHMLSKEIENKPDAFILKDGNNKISEDEMRILTDELMMPRKLLRMQMKVQTMLAFPMLMRCCRNTALKILHPRKGKNLQRKAIP